MVLLSTVQAVNAQASSALPSGVVAVFAGATSGIGELALRAFATHAPKPRVYFIGRSQEAGDRLERELKGLNAAGEFVFIRADLSLMRNVDEVAARIADKEQVVNVLFMSQGVVKMGETPDGLPYMTAVGLYSRIRLAAQLLPLLQCAPSLRRVVTTLAGTKEGRLYADDVPGRRVPVTGARGHMVTAMTLALEALARRAPTVSFVHNFPGPVRSNLIRREDGLLLQPLKWLFAVTLWNKWLDGAEVGERHAYLCLAAAYPPREGSDARGVPVQPGSGAGGDAGAGAGVANGTDGVSGSGVYTVDWDNESAGPEVVKLLERYRAEGMVDKVWAHMEGEFKRILG